MLAILKLIVILLNTVLLYSTGSQSSCWKSEWV